MPGQARVRLCSFEPVGAQRRWEPAAEAGAPPLDHGCGPCVFFLCNRLLKAMFHDKSIPTRPASSDDCPLCSLVSFADMISPTTRFEFSAALHDLRQCNTL